MARVIFLLTEEKNFQKSTNQKQELPVAAMFVNRSDKISNLYRRPSIDASYQVSVHLAKRFQRRRFLKKSANQKQELPVAAMYVNGSGQNVQSLERTLQMLPTKFQFILAEGFQRRRLRCEKLTDDGRRTPSDLQGELKIKRAKPGK